MVVNWNRKTVLVTGGCGHIGSFVVRSLLKRKVGRIIIVDSLSAYPFDQTMIFCGDILTRDDIVFRKKDIANYGEIREVFKDVNIVFHLAAYADVAATIYNPDEDIRTNINGTYNVLKACRENGVEKYVFASSAAVYGDQPWIDNKPPAFKEDLRPNPLSTYANSKLWGEFEAKLFHKLYGLRTTSLRYFSVYGPMQVPKPKSHSWVVAIFIVRSLRGKPLTVYGGDQVRDFIYVEDVAEATVRAAEVNGIEGEAINVGTGIPTRIIDLAETVSSVIKETLGHSIKIDIDVVDYRPLGDPKGGYADTTKMKGLLGFTPKTDILEGIKKTLEWWLNSGDVVIDWV